MGLFTQSVQKIIILLLRGYRFCISPLFGPRCRFHPSCSQYALAAVKKFPLYRSLWLILWRVLRCQPFCEGGYDPLP